jgi:hypothetical protein
MKSFALVLVLAFALGVTAQSSTPTWPSAFSATIVVSNGFSPFPQFFRWFYDSNQNIDRLDGLIQYNGQNYFAERIFNHNTQNQTAIYYQPNLAFCEVGPVNHPLPVPNFSGFTYVGNSLVDYVATTLWVQKNSDSIIEYWQTAESGQPIEPKKFQYGFQNATSSFSIGWDFVEFDEGPQDPSLFAVPSALAATCQSF